MTEQEIKALVSHSGFFQDENRIGGYMRIEGIMYEVCIPIGYGTRVVEKQEILDLMEAKLCELGVIP